MNPLGLFLRLRNGLRWPSRAGDLYDGAMFFAMCAAGMTAFLWVAIGALLDWVGP